MAAVYGQAPFSSSVLTSGGSKNLNVNGASSSVVFTYSPASGCASLVYGLSCIFRHEGNTSLSNFGALGALTNGVLIQATVAGTTYTIATIKDNQDLSTIFHFNQFGNSAVLSLLSVVTPEGFGNSNNVFVGHHEIKEGFWLQPGDFITVTVQDNISAINNFQINVNGLTFQG